MYENGYILRSWIYLTENGAGMVLMYGLSVIIWIRLACLSDDD